MGPWDYPFWGFSPYRGRNLTFLFSISFSLTDYIQVVILFTNMSSVVFFVFCKDHSHLFFSFLPSGFLIWFQSLEVDVTKGRKLITSFLSAIGELQVNLVSLHPTKSGAHAFSFLIFLANSYRNIMCTFISFLRFGVRLCVPEYRHTFSVWDGNSFVLYVYAGCKN